jgi:N6-adenosine-specific RNA methylase IME4
MSAIVKAQTGKALTYYDNARRALAQAARVDDVKKIHDQASAMKEYARRAKDHALSDYATEIRLHAEKRGGEMLALMREKGERDRGSGGNRKSKSRSQPATVKLKDLGVTKTQSSRWQIVAKLKPDDFEELVETAKRKSVAGMNSANNSEINKKMRTLHEREWADRILALPDVKVGVVLADPEWKYVTYSENGKDHSAENHYNTSEVEKIKARFESVKSICAKDCALFLWAIAPMLKQAIEVGEACGLELKSQCVWYKPDKKGGQGHWFYPFQHEILLVFTKGKVVAPAKGTQWPSVIVAPCKGLKHSEKPEIFHELIEAYFPNVPKIELNARRKRDGWIPWGTLEWEDEAV